MSGGIRRGVQFVHQIGQGLAGRLDVCWQFIQGIFEDLERLIQSDKGPDHLHGVDIGLAAGLGLQVEAFNVLAELLTGGDGSIAQAAIFGVPFFDGFQHLVARFDGALFFGEEVGVIGGLQLGQACHAYFGLISGVSQGISQVDKIHAHCIGLGAGQRERLIKGAEIQHQARNCGPRGLASRFHGVRVIDNLQGAGGYGAVQLQGFGQILAL